MITALAAFGVVDHAPLELSDVLKSLNMSHTYVWRDGFRINSMDIDGGRKEQPVWPVIVQNVKTLDKVGSGGRFVYFVTDSRAALSHTNINAALWPENRKDHHFNDCMRWVLIHSHKKNEEWVLQKNEPTLMDYVNSATKPSQLNNLQSLFYKINPYALRKEIQILCISYLAGYTSHKLMREKLKSSLKFADLLELMESPKTKALRDAVARVRTEPIEKVVKETGAASFELMYLIKSGTQNKS